MFFFAHISFSTFGQTVTLTSPRWALRSSSIRVRDWPMPPPMESGISLLMMRLMIGELEIVEQVRHFELLRRGFRRSRGCPWTEFVAALSDVVPDQNVAVESVSIAAGLRRWCR